MFCQQDCWQNVGFLPYWQNVILVKCVDMDGEGRERKQSSVAGKKKKKKVMRGYQQQQQQANYIITLMAKEKKKESNRTLKALLLFRGE